MQKDPNSILAQIEAEKQIFYDKDGKDHLQGNIEPGDSTKRMTKKERKKKNQRKTEVGKQQKSQIKPTYHPQHNLEKLLRKHTTGQGSFIERPEAVTRNEDKIQKSVTLPVKVEYYDERTSEKESEAL